MNGLTHKNGIALRQGLKLREDVIPQREVEYPKRLDVDLSPAAEREHAHILLQNGRARFIRQRVLPLKGDGCLARVCLVPVLCHTQERLSTCPHWL